MLQRADHGEESQFFGTFNNILRSLLNGIISEYKREKVYNVDGSRNSFHCFFSGCHKRLRKLNHEELTLKYRPEFAFNLKHLTRLSGGGKRVKRGHVAASSA